MPYIKLCNNYGDVNYINTDHINLVKETISPSGNHRHTTIVLSCGEYLSQLPIEKVMGKIYKATKEDVYI